MRIGELYIQSEQHKVLKRDQEVRLTNIESEFCMYWLFIKVAFFLKNKFITSSGMGSISGMTATLLPISAAFERKLKMTLAGLSISRLYEGVGYRMNMVKKE